MGSVEIHVGKWIDEGAVLLCQKPPTTVAQLSVPMVLMIAGD